jgi:SHS family lactate transporter-like MFS transporter
MKNEVAWWREPTKGQWFAFGAAWWGWVLDAFDFTIFFLAMPYIAKEMGVSDTATATSITLTLLMRLLGGAAAGALADRYGRKLPLMMSIVWFAVCDGLVAIAPTFAWILVLRTLFGFGMGAEWTSGATLAMENWPERSKNIASGVLQGSWAIGYLLASAAFAILVPMFGWRSLFVVALVPALLALPIRIFVPESPEWQRARAKAKPPGLSSLLDGAMLKNIVWASILMSFGFGIYYALSGLYPTMLAKDLGFGTDRIAILVALFNVGMMVGAVTAGVLATRFGVAKAIVIPSLLMLPMLPLYVGIAGPMEVGAFFGGAFGVGFCGVVPALLTGLFPPTVRARAVGLVYHVGAFAAAFVPPIVAGLAERMDMSRAVSMATVSAICLVGVSTVVGFRPKEARARAAEEPALAGDCRTDLV